MSSSKKSAEENLTSNPFGKYNGNEAKYVLEALDSENPKNKEVPWVRRFEAAFAEKLGSQFAIAHNSGTSTLHSCLAAAGVGPGDEVIVPAYTVIMCTWAALYQNAVPVFADSEPGTFNIDPEDIRRKITSKTKAIIAVHMHGLPSNIPAIMKIVEGKNISVIEDSAQCVLGKIDGKMAGTLGHCSSFSFETKKHLSTGEGGMVCTNDEALATYVRKHGGLGYKTLSGKSGLRNVLPTEFQDPDYKRHDIMGWNYRMPELLAAVGLAQLERVEQLVERRKVIAKLYLEALDDCDWIVPQVTPAGYENTYWTFAAKFEGEAALGVKWKEFYNLHKENGGDGFYAALSLAYDEIVMKKRDFYGQHLPKDKSLYPQEFIYPTGTCPVAESFQPKIMQFKTNYRNLEMAKQKIGILKKTIQQIQDK